MFWYSKFTKAGGGDIKYRIKIKQKKMNKYLSKWTITRGIQLVVGVVFLNTYFSDGDFFGLAFGGLMFFQAVLNVGCFSSKGCSTSASEPVTKMTKKDLGELEVEYEEL